MTNLAICGVTGKMGNAILDNIAEDQTVILSAATVKKGSIFFNKALSELKSNSALKNNIASIAKNEVEITNSVKITNKVKITSSLLNNSNFDVAIDFSTPLATLEYLDQCVKLNKPMVIGTTGFSKAELEKIHLAANKIPVLLAPNMSLGVNILYALLEATAKATKSGDWDIAISEIHHKSKKDSPSGTALEMGKIITKALEANLETGIGTNIDISTNIDMSTDAKANQQATNKQVKVVTKQLTTKINANSKNNVKSNKNIQYNSLRLANSKGEHRVIFATTDEKIELAHISTNRDIFARGAITAAKWLAKKNKGLYTMRDVINL